MNQTSPLNFVEAAGGFHKSAVIRAAIELDVCTGVAAGLNTAQTLALARHCSLKGMRVLLDALTVLDLLRKRGDAYELCEEAKYYLDRSSPNYAGEALRFLMSSFMELAFSRFTDAVRLGGTAVGMEGTLAPEHPVWVEYAQGMIPLSTTTAEVVGEMMQGSGRILDIAAGHGLLGIEVLKRSPGARAVAVDWPNVLELARANASAAGVKDRWSGCEGNALDVEWGDAYDCVIIANFLHQFSRPVAVQILRRAYEGMTKGGRLALVALAPDSTRVKPSAPAWFAVMVLATTPDGEAYTLGEYEAMLAEVGFGAPQVHKVPASARVVLVSIK